MGIAHSSLPTLPSHSILRTRSKRASCTLNHFSSNFSPCTAGRAGSGSNGSSNGSNGSNSGTHLSSGEGDSDDGKDLGSVLTPHARHRWPRLDQTVKTARSPRLRVPSRGRSSSGVERNSRSIGGGGQVRFDEAAGEDGDALPRGDADDVHLYSWATSRGCAHGRVLMKRRRGGGGGRGCRRAHLPARVGDFAWLCSHGADAARRCP